MWFLVYIYINIQREREREDMERLCAKANIGERNKRNLSSFGFNSWISWFSLLMLRCKYQGNIIVLHSNHKRIKFTRTIRLNTIIFYTTNAIPNHF